MKDEDKNLSMESGFMSGDISTDTNELLLIPLSDKGCTCDVFRKVYMGKTTVIKRLRTEQQADTAYRELFRKEYETGIMLDCPYLVRYLDYTDNESVCQIETEFVDGDTLNERLQTNSTYFSDKNNLNKFLLQLLEGLRYLHSHQIVHLDIKPDNIMLSKVNNDVKILDLGFCYSDTFQTSLGCNTLFAAPEQVDGSADIDARTDIYSFGKLLEYILFYADVPHAHRYKKVIERCTQKDKKLRYQDVDSVIKEISNSSYSLTKIITLSAGILALVVMVVLLFNVVNLHRLIYGYDFSDYTLCYNILSKEDKTCEIVKHDASLEESGVGNVVIKDEVEYKDEMYKVKSVDPQAFLNDSTITKLSILSNDIHFGREAFRYCSKLSSLYVDDDFNAFSQGLFGCCLSLESFRFLSAMVEVPQACFHKTGLKNLDLPDGIKMIHQDAFCDCDSLTSVILPPNLITLERGVFFDCNNLQKVTIPASVKNIGQYCFMGCTSLKAVYNYSPTPQRVSEIFDETAHLTVFVPKGSVELYRQSPYWNNQDIQPMEK